MADSPRDSGKAPRSERAVRLAAALVLLITVVAISIAVELTGAPRSVILWTVTGALFFVAIIFAPRR